MLCGLDELGVRTLQQLRRLDEDVVVIARAPSEAVASRRGLAEALASAGGE